MTRIGLVTGLQVEARIAERAGRRYTETNELLIACQGPGPRRAYAAARKLIDRGVDGLVSFGIAGGLDPSLAPGDLVVAGAVVRPSGPAVAADPVWQASFAALLAPSRAASHGLVLGSDVPLRHMQAKADAFRGHGAVAVDMESAGIAGAAQSAGLPFLIVRVVADPAARSIPATALAGIDTEGHRRPARVVAGLVRRPGELPALWRLGRDSAVAMARLGRVAARALPGFGLEVVGG